MDTPKTDEAENCESETGNEAQRFSKGIHTGCRDLGNSSGEYVGHLKSSNLESSMDLLPRGLLESPRIMIRAAEKGEPSKKELVKPQNILGLQKKIVNSFRHLCEIQPAPLGASGHLGIMN